MSRWRSITVAVGISAMLSLCMMMSEALHLTLRSEFFLAELGAAAIQVIGAYALVALVFGILVGALVRSPLRQAFVLSALYFALISLKILWRDTALLTVPVIAAAFSVFALGFFGTSWSAARRLRLSFAFPVQLVVAYCNICLGVASGWATTGGRLGAFLLSSRTLAVAGAGVVAVVGLTALQVWSERRADRRWHALVPLALIIALTGTTIIMSRRVQSTNGTPAIASPTAPDVYVLSFDALRSDDLRAFIEAHPESKLAQLAAKATTFVNVVSHGTSTEYILRNNTFSAGETCGASVPEQMARAGYITSMMYGGQGRRFDWSNCYRYYFAGGKESLVARFALPALVSAGSSTKDELRHKYLSASYLLTKLAAVAKTPTPIYSYLHFLELHAPYIPGRRARDAGFLHSLDEYMRGCYSSGCRSIDPVNAAVIKNARDAYLELFEDVDSVVEHALAIADARARPYVLIVTADHGELFGERGGFAHSGGFVSELLDVPFLVFDSRRPKGGSRCELMLTSEAIRATALGATTGMSYPDHEVLEWEAPPLGSARVDKKEATVRYEIRDEMLPHAGTWRNVHRDKSGTLPYPIERCD